MNNHYFDFLIVPEVGSNARKWRFSKRGTRVVLSLVGFILALGIVGFIDYIQLATKRWNISKAYRETQIYNEKIHVLQQKIALLEQGLDRLAAFKNKIRLLANVEEDRSSQSLAIGPLSEQEEQYRQQAAFSDSDAQSTYMNFLPEDLFIKASELEEQVTLEEVDFASLFETLQDQRSFLVSMPSILPSRGFIHSRFGMRKSPFTGKTEVHEGIDIASEYGTDIVATADGVVVFSGVQNGYGKVLVIDHGYGLVTKYGHSSQLLVSIGDRVKRGEVVAKVGSTGRTTGPHLHYEVRRNGVPVDPTNFIIFDSQL